MPEFYGQMISIVEHEIRQYFSVAIRLALRAFPSIHDIEARLQRDPDTDEDRVVIDLTMAGDVADVLAAKKSYTKEWIRVCPPEIRDKIRLLYHLV